MGYKIKQWRTSLVAQMVKNPPAMHKTWVPSLGWEDSLEEGMASNSSILAWRIPRTEEPSGLQSVGLQRVGHNCVTKHTKAFWTRVLGWNPLKGIANESCEAALCYICEFFHWNILAACRSLAFYMELCLLFRRRQWHPTPVLLLGKSHGWRSLSGCNPWGC